MALRARDIRVLCREHGTEQGIMMAVEALADEMAGYRQNMKDMAELLATCIDHVSSMVSVGEAMTTRLDEIKRREEQYHAVTSERPDGSA